MQALMRQFSIRTRMLGAIGVVLALLAVIGSAGLWGMAQLQAGTESLLRTQLATPFTVRDCRWLSGGALER